MNSLDQIVEGPILVTGASGFIGGHLCRRLLDGGATVHGVSRSKVPSESEKFQWWQADLSDLAAVRRIFSATQPEIVFHLASHVVGARELEVVLPTFNNNLASTVNLLTVATEAGCRRVVLACSSEEPQGQDSSVPPCSPYAAAKYAGTIYARMFHQLFKTPVVMPRIFMTYGPNQRDLQKLVPFVTRGLLRGRAPKLTSGRRRADWIYVDDVVEVLLRAAIAPGIVGCTFDLGSGSLVSVQEIVEQIRQIIGPSVEPAFGALADRSFEQERAADTTFLAQALGYQTRTSLREGLKATVGWYREQASELWLE